MELPRLEAIYRKFKEEGLEIIAVEAFRDRERAQAFIAEKALSFTFLENGTDDADVVSNVFDVSKYPTSFLIDELGKILSVHIGFKDGDQDKIAEEVERLLSL